MMLKESFHSLCKKPKQRQFEENVPHPPVKGKSHIDSIIFSISNRPGNSVAIHRWKDYMQQILKKKKK